MDLIFCSLIFRMLYDFHASQNEKRSGTVHATYMIYGTKKIAETNGQSQKDGDVDMTSSPPGVESALDEIPVIDLSLVAEGCLKGTSCCLSLLA